MGPRRTLVREVNPHLICVLCRGYFVEATTITECLHSFCRSCLIKYLETSKFCPICDVQLHKNNPLLSVRCDPTLQQLVYKLIPGLYANEMARRRKYYSELGGPSSDPECSEYPVGDAYFAPEDSISLSLEFTAIPNNKEEELSGSDAEDAFVDKQSVLHRRYLQCPAAVTMSHLQKFLRMKYGFSHNVKVDIIYEGEVLSDEFSLMDVAYTFNWQRTAPMRFKFRLLQKSDVSSKGYGIERIKKHVDVKENSETVQKPTAETKVFAFATLLKTSSPTVHKSSCHTSSLKPSDDSKSVAVVLEVKEVKEIKTPKINKKDLTKGDRGRNDLASKEGKELERIKQTKTNISSDKPIEKNSSSNPFKRAHPADRADEAVVGAKKLKIILEPPPAASLKEDKKKPALAIAPPKEVTELKPKQIEKPKIFDNKRAEPKSDLRVLVEKLDEKVSSKKDFRKIVESSRKLSVKDDDEEDEPNYMDDIIQEDDYEDDEDEGRLHISPSDEEMVVDEKVDSASVADEVASPPKTELPAAPEPAEVPEPEPVKSYSRSEEKRKEKKKNKKAKHHHHRHHDRKRDSPPIATILHSPDNDLKLKFKLTNTNSKTKYTIMDNSDSKKDYTIRSSPKHSDKYADKEYKNKNKDTFNEVPKKSPSPVINNNYNNLNNNNSFHNTFESPKFVETGSKEKTVQLKLPKQKSSPALKVPPPTSAKPTLSPIMSSFPKTTPIVPKQVGGPAKQVGGPTKQVPLIKQNGAQAMKQETIKLPPSSITVSKITAAEKAQMEQQKLFMNRSNSLGLDSKRPSLEIMLVNAPKKAGEAVVESKPVEVKKVMRPTPPSIPLSRLKNFSAKGSPPPLVLANKVMSSSDDNGALDLSGKSSRKSPEVDNMRNLVLLSNAAVQERCSLSSLEPLKIPVPPVTGVGLKQNFLPQSRPVKPGPNQTVRQIPNPSALMYRQHAFNSQRSVPPSLPINSLRKMESMAKNINIEKVAAGLSVKAAVEAGYHPK